MTKRFTTVELPKPNIWGIMHDGDYISTYEICHLLNDAVDLKKENTELKKFIKSLANNKGQIFHMNGYVYNIKKIIKE